MHGYYIKEPLPQLSSLKKILHIFHNMEHIIGHRGGHTESVSHLIPAYMNSYI